MNRRQLLAAGAVLLIRPSTGTAAERRFLCYDRPADKWVPIRGHDIKPGDEIWVDDPPSCSLVIRVTHNDPDKRQLLSDYEIDPKTNHWVPAGVSGT